MDNPDPKRALIISDRVADLAAEMERAAPGASQIAKMPKGQRERQKYYQYYLELKEMLRDSVKETSDPDLALLLRTAIVLAPIRLKETQGYRTTRHLTRQ